jgi:predicted dienelactone hydrolase
MLVNGNFKVFGALIFGLTIVFFACDPDNGAYSNIEVTYAANGPYATKSKSVTGFKIFYPKRMEGDHPIITWGNGTGAMTTTYRAFLNHLASWGFVVIASNNTMNQNGNRMVAGIDYLIRQNNSVGSEFYGKLDTNRIGTTGHSQGGGGAINAAKDRRVTCSASMAPSTAGIRQVKGPVFLVAGRLDFAVSPTLVRSTIYANANGPTVFGIVNGMGHMGFAGNAGGARGYVTAWFMYHLQDEEYAGGAFIGKCEICSDSDWTVKMKNFP